MTTPYVQEWNLTLEKQLPWKMAWDTTYVGNIAVHNWVNLPGNQPLTNGPGSPTTRRPLAKYTQAAINETLPIGPANYSGSPPRWRSNSKRASLSPRRLPTDVRSTCRILPRRSAWGAVHLPTPRETALQLRFEAFNALNHPQFAQPGSTVGTTTFGVVTATSQANRTLQVGARLVF